MDLRYRHRNPLLLEALSAEHWAALGWAKRNCRLHSALGTNGARLGAHGAAGSAFRLALFTSLRIVPKLFVVKEELFPGRENKLVPTVHTFQSPVDKIHSESLAFARLEMPAPGLSTEPYSRLWPHSRSRNRRAGPWGSMEEKGGSDSLRVTLWTLHRRDAATPVVRVISPKKGPCGYRGNYGAIPGSVCGFSVKNRRTGRSCDPIKTKNAVELHLPRVEVRRSAGSPAVASECLFGGNRHVRKPLITLRSRNRPVCRFPVTVTLRPAIKFQNET
jgi:hypothetical protein